MNDRRSTITLKWRPAGAPARHHDDFVEVPFAQPEAVEPPPVDRSAIEARLLNWGRWAKSSDGPAGAACMTGAICESMRKAAGGGAASTGEPGATIDANDAVLVGRAMIKVTFDQRRLLGLLYVDEQRKGFIAALLRILPQEFDRYLADAQDAIDAAISSYQNSNSK